MAALPTPCPPVRPNCRSRVPFGLAPIVGAVLGLAASGAGHAGDCPADVNGDTLVDGVDLGVVLAFWGEPPALFPPADINGDGAIDAADLTLVLGAWGECPVVGCPTEFAWQPGFEQAPVQYWGTGVYALKTFNDGR
ncbi:MAG: dockerin type I domain-containing protein, partial [Candidatus Nanopelagicales bacterium]